MPDETQEAVVANTTDNQIQDEWNEKTVYGPSIVTTVLDQIEDLVESSRAVPLSASIMANKTEILNLFDQAYKALPGDLVVADAVIADVGAVLGRVDSTAETRIVKANSRASSIPDQTNECAVQILTDAEEEAERTRSHINDEATAFVPQTRSDAEATTANASAQATRTISTENIVRITEDHAREIASEAEHSVAPLCEGADNYVAFLLDGPAHLISDLARRTDAGRRAIAKCRGADVIDVDLISE